MITAIAAGLGYAFAVYPIWYHVDQVRKTETLGGLISVVEARKQFLGAYLDDSRVDATAFDDIAWAVKTVMTPFVGYAPAPGQQHNAHINSFQFRDRREPAMPKPPGVTRIFLTGASVAFSAGAPDDQRTIGGYLQSLLDRRGTGQHYEVFTFAAPAWSSTHERIAIENRLSDLQPDLVVELTGIADALYGERGHNVLWARALTDQYYWDLVNIALRRAGFAPMTDVQDASSERVPPELVAARLQKNVRLASGALALGERAAARLPAARHRHDRQGAHRAREGPALQQVGLLHRSGVLHRTATSGSTRCSATAACPRTPRSRTWRGCSIGCPETQDIFLDSYHFGDRGSLLIAQAIVEAIR